MVSFRCEREAKRRSFITKYLVDYALASLLTAVRGILKLCDFVANPLVEQPCLLITKILRNLLTSLLKLANRLKKRKVTQRAALFPTKTERL